MTLQIIGYILVAVFGAGTFLVKKVLAAVLKREPEEKQVVLFKFIGLLGTFAGLLMVLIPDMINR